MAKTQVRYVCQECGRVSARQMGRCPQCGKFDTMVEEIIAPEPSAKHNRTQRGLSIQSKPLRLQEIEGGADERMPLSISEFARVLGGGIVPGSIVLVGGDPGIGKSTPLLQITMELSSPPQVDAKRRKSQKNPARSTVPGDGEQFRGHLSACRNCQAGSDHHRFDPDRLSARG